MAQPEWISAFAVAVQEKQDDLTLAFYREALRLRGSLQSEEQVKWVEEPISSRIRSSTSAVPVMFKPQVGPFRLTDYETVYASDPTADIFELRRLDRGGVVVVVRPDQYVACVLPLGATAELGAFFAPLLKQRQTAAAVR